MSAVEEPGQVGAGCCPGAPQVRVVKLLDNFRRGLAVVDLQALYKEAMDAQVTLLVHSQRAVGPPGGPSLPCPGTPELAPP